MAFKLSLRGLHALEVLGDLLEIEAIIVDANLVEDLLLEQS